MTAVFEMVPPKRRRWVIVAAICVLAAFALVMFLVGLGASGDGAKYLFGVSGSVLGIALTLFVDVLYEDYKASNAGAEDFIISTRAACDELTDAAVGFRFATGVLYERMEVAGAVKAELDGDPTNERLQQRMKDVDVAQKEAEDAVRTSAPKAAGKAGVVLTRVVTGPQRAAAQAIFDAAKVFPPVLADVETALGLLNDDATAGAETDS